MSRSSASGRTFPDDLTPLRSAMKVMTLLSSRHRQSGHCG